MSRSNVSVVITTYNRAELLLRAIKSILSQKYDNFDLHVVDDCSSDATSAVVKDLLANKSNSYYWRHNGRRGLAAARNTGIARSNGEYIAFLDDDDEWKTESLGRRIEALLRLSDADRVKVGVVYCGCEIRVVDENHVSYHMPQIEGNIRENLLRQNLSTIPSSCLFSRTALDRIGGFDENLCSSIDHDIWMSLAIHEFHALAVMEPLIITYYIKNRMTMVSDVSQRIRGVEQYLDKWSPTYELWFGEKEGLNHVKKYRIRVLGNLAGIKLGQGGFRQTHQLVRHIIGKDKSMSLNHITLVKTMVLSALRECIPVRLKRILRNIRGLIQKNAC